jgi:hypothetical protein
VVRNLQTPIGVGIGVISAYDLSALIGPNIGATLLGQRTTGLVLSWFPIFVCAGMLLYTVAVVPFTYCFSFLFSDHNSGSNFVACIFVLYRQSIFLTIDAC